MMQAIDKRFQNLASDLVANGLRQYFYDSELWFYEQGLEILASRAASAFIRDSVAGATAEEKKFAEIVWKHFPLLRQRSREIHRKGN